MERYFLEDNATGEFAFHIAKSIERSDFGIHTHNFSELAIITGGSALHSIEGDEYLVRPGDVFVINGNTSHGFLNVSDMVIYNVMFDPGLIFDGFPDLRNLGGFHALFFIEPNYRRLHRFESRLRLDPAGLEYVQSLLNSMIKEYNLAPDGYISQLRAHFISLAIFLSRRYAGCGGTEQNNLLGMAQAMTYLENHFTESITLKYLSELAVMSERNFERLFRQVYRTTPFEYIMKLRLSKACDMLRDGSAGTSEVAFECGFSDSNYFSRRFKKQFGVCPKQIKRLILY